MGGNIRSCKIPPREYIESYENNTNFVSCIKMMLLKLIRVTF